MCFQAEIERKKRNFELKTLRLDLEEERPLSPTRKVESPSVSRSRSTSLSKGENKRHPSPSHDRSLKSPIKKESGNASEMIKQRASSFDKVEKPSVHSKDSGTKFLHFS